MRTRHLALAVGLAAAAFLGPRGLPAQQPADQQGVEPLARGPVHEAFAQPVTGRVEEPDLAPREPPAPIDEMPPDEKPEGDNLEWIPGYWDWDEEQNDFLWVSGCWRDAPPGRHWVPGHWQEVRDGYQWTRGFWADDEEDELEYVPPPPPSIDAGPSSPQPDPNSVYVPGCWVYREQRFFWRPGYWLEHRPDWVWVPCHYVRTPGGCLFVKGFWDLPLHERGLLFAPVRFERRVLAARVAYTPNYVVRTDFLLGAMFVRESLRTYYFGDYFEERYQKRGFVAWPEHRAGKAYDQNYLYYRQAYRDREGWEESLRTLYQGRRTGEVPRPPHTLAQQAKVVNNLTVSKTENVTVNKSVNVTNVQNVTVLNRVKEVRNQEVTALAGLGKSPAREGKAARPAKVLKLQEVPREQRERYKEAASHLREVSEQRLKVEKKLHADGGVPVNRAEAPRPQAPPQPAAPKLKVPKPKQAAGGPAGPKPMARPKPPPAPQMPRPVERQMPRSDPPRKVDPPKPKPDKPKGKD